HLTNKRKGRTGYGPAFLTFWESGTRFPILAFCCDTCYHSLNHASFYLCISSKNLEYIPKGNSSVILRNGDYYMRRNAALAAIALLVSFACSACAPAAPSGQTPEFFDDIGKTLSELKTEHPEGKFM